MQAPGPKPLRGRRRRLADGLIGLSAIAIATVYGVGYINTSSAHGTPAPVTASRSQQDPPASAPSLQQAPASSQAQAPSAAQGPSVQPTRTPSNQTSGSNISYKDGTYTGRGSSRHGDIEATVVVKDGQIVSANVSRCMTRYSCSYVSPLVNLVLSRQVVPTEHISGATDSSNAYKHAIQNALQGAAALS
jgi:uncharacterized protein with FMN-binding domain